MNQQALGCYGFSLWDKVLKLKEKLPDEAKQEFTVMVEEQIGCYKGIAGELGCSSRKGFLHHCAA